MDERRVQAIFTLLERFKLRDDESFLVQSIEEQALMVCAKGRVINRYDASTSRFGFGTREQSFKTPPGIHRIREKIGSGAPMGRIFRDRRDGGVDWDGSTGGDNLILTRILRLEGLEEGVNRGAGVDSYERFIYIHGTNREESVGSPLSHGCIAMRNGDIVRLFDDVSEGTLVYIEPPPVTVAGVRCRTFHFTGIFGTGMSALAQYLRFQGYEVSGSDRLGDSRDTATVRSALEALRCTIVDQDGSGVDEFTDALCVSTAIEESNPDIAAATARQVPLIHRSDLLAALIESKETIAVAGTSGKSTVTAMVFEFLTACGRSPSLISGAPLRRLEKEGLIGNAFSGASNLLVVEADESDGSIVKYHPHIALVLNVSKDHKSIGEITGFFRTLLSQSAWSATNGDDPILATLPATVRFGRSRGVSGCSGDEELLPTSVKLLRDTMCYHLPLPGAHNLENLRAALTVCDHLGCDGEVLANAVERFEGVARRFAVTKTREGVIVVDDFAHNPAKIAAAVSAARGLSERIIAVYQPHGFGPTRFLKDDYVETFRTVFHRGDSLYLLPIYYAGGTAKRDILSEDLVEAAGTIPFSLEAVRDRDALLEKLTGDAGRTDCILIMGARDPSLPSLVKKVVELFGGEAKD